MSQPVVKPLPRYFLVDFEIGVHVYQEGNEVIGVNHMGNPYPPIKALYEGQEITREEYIKLKQAK